VTRQNWVSEKADCEPGIAIHSACYAMLVAHLPQRTALVEQEMAEKGVEVSVNVDDVDSRAMACDLFEFCEKRLPQTCRYTLDCLCFEPLINAHEQFFTFHHAMLWALCTPSRPLIALESRADGGEEVAEKPKTRGNRSNGALRVSDFTTDETFYDFTIDETLSDVPVVTLSPSHFHEFDATKLDLARFNGVTDFFDYIVVNFLSCFETLAVLSQLSKSFYHHVAGLWKPV
jgi:hypothetical protein